MYVPHLRTQQLVKTGFSSSPYHFQPGDLGTQYFLCLDVHISEIEISGETTWHTVSDS